MSALGWGAAALSAALLLGSCASSGLYYWGSYEDSVGRVAGAEDFDVAAEVDRLETDLEKAQNEDRPVPPGFHAHLAYLLYLQGDTDGAVRQLETEKSRYPEGGRFVDFLLQRIAGSATP